MRLKPLFAAATLLLASAGASAQTTSVFNLTSGSFAFPYTFSLTGPATVTGDTNSSGISWVGVTLSNPAALFSASDANPDDGFSFSGLSAGNYTLTFQGSGTGGFGGYYTVTAVPEPGTVALMLAGLGLVGFVGARRRQR